MLHRALRLDRVDPHVRGVESGLALERLPAEHTVHGRPGRDRLHQHSPVHVGAHGLAQQRQRRRGHIEDTRPVHPLASATMALEHYTAMMAAEFLANPKHFADADPEVRAMWQWHAAEEIEHKGVAFDTWNHATRYWTDWKRWKVRSLMMLIVTGRFFKNRWEDSMNLLAQDGITGWKARWGLFKYLAWSPGVVRRIFPAWLAYFKPGFHPWDHDDRALIKLYEGEFPDALMAAE
ncbi:metal-dependent hydrolase [Leptolyngbya sp. 15MV]|nr:metal-dependent hydrolase [Leptolyngbya sp. 15MV]